MNSIFRIKANYKNFIIKKIIIRKVVSNFIIVEKN